MPCTLHTPYALQPMPYSLNLRPYKLTDIAHVSHLHDGKAGPDEAVAAYCDEHAKERVLHPSHSQPFPGCLAHSQTRGPEPARAHARRAHPNEVSGVGTARDAPLAEKSRLSLRGVTVPVNLQVVPVTRDTRHGWAWWLGLAPATLEFWVRFPIERNQGKQSHPVLKYRAPHGSQHMSSTLLPPREQLCNRSCSNKHTHTLSSACGFSR